MPSFSNKKYLRFVITLGEEAFGDTETNQIILQGFRSTVDVDKAGGMMMGTLRAKIYGVKQEDMNSITTLVWRPRSLVFNTIQVYAIDGSSESLVFSGNIVNAWADYQGIPDVFLHIHSQSAYFNQLRPAAPKSFKGNVDVAVVMNQIADDMGLKFEGNNVKIQLADVYLPNTLLEQAKELAKMAGCDFYIDDDVLAITPQNTPREGIIPVISSATGLVGYPTFDSTGISIKILFDPAVTFGGAVQLETTIPQAAGEWVVTSMGYRLESEKPGGAWFATIRGNANAFAVRKR